MMKTNRASTLTFILMCLATQSGLAAVGTSFTYQGRIKDGSSWANGTYDLYFGLYDVVSGSSALATDETTPTQNLTIADGFFTVALDFNNVFTGDRRWLEIGIRDGNSTGAYTTLSPRQELKPVPYAMYAANGGGGGGSSGGWTDNGTSVYVTESSRKVGIGTTTPVCRLAVEADQAGDPRSLLRVKNLASTNDTYLDLYVGVPGWFDDYALFLRNGVIVFGIASDNWFWLNQNMAIADGKGFQSTANGNYQLFLRDGGGNFQINSGGNTVFNMTGTERVRITNNGNVGIGTTAPVEKLDVSGNVRCVDVIETSDERLKTDVRRLENVLAKLDRVRGVSFQWNEQARSLGGKTGQRQIGLLAQELEQVFPELVETPDVNPWIKQLSEIPKDRQNPERRKAMEQDIQKAQYKGVSYSKLTAVLLEAVKELKAENESLKKRLAALEEKVK